MSYEINNVAVPSYGPSYQTPEGGTGAEPGTEYSSEILVSDLSGIMGIALHEVAHLSSAGVANLDAELQMFVLEHQRKHTPYTSAEFYSTDYSSDNEAFCDDFVASLDSLAIGFDLSDYSAGTAYDGNFIGAQAVYNMHFFG